MEVISLLRKYLILSITKVVGIFRLQISRKTDVIALAAFLIALGGVAYQISGYIKGVEITGVNLKQVRLHALNRDNGSDIRVVASLAYINTGQAGHNGVIIDEKLDFTLSIDGQTSRYSYESLENAKTIYDENEPLRLILVDRSTAGPFVVNAGSAHTHETVFGWVAENEPFYFSHFEKYLSDLVSSNSSISARLELFFQTEVLGEDGVIVECKSEIGINEYIRMMKHLSAVFDCE